MSLEGERTMGVWLPLAMSDLYSALVALIRVMVDSSTAKSITIPKRSDMLSAWALPLMASGLKADEDEHEALEMLKSVERLAKRSQSANDAR